MYNLPLMPKSLLFVLALRPPVWPAGSPGPARETVGPALWPAGPGCSTAGLAGQTAGLAYWIDCSAHRTAGPAR